jgi:exoribonuclease R
MKTRMNEDNPTRPSSAGYLPNVPSLRVTVLTEDLRPGLDQIRREFKVPAEFPPAVEAAAAQQAGRSFSDGRRRRDKRSLPLLTIDPPGSSDLDQAFSARRLRTGYRVHYAIADVAAFVSPGGTVEGEAWRRGQTLYMPDRRAPLYPTVLSEGAASLLPDTDRPALLWTIDLDEDGGVISSQLEPALVRSRRALSYAGAQSAIDSGRADGTLQLLREIGLLRERHERERDGISLNLPTREVTPTPGGYRFRYEATLPVERWNAQISLLAGHCAATIMVDGGVGILRTLPPVRRQELAKLRRVAAAVDIDWPEGASLGDVVRSQDGRSPESTAFLTQATHALRGAGYALVGDAARSPPIHGGLGMIYAHVTAPLRRLADRYANEALVALCAGGPPPAWVTEALARLPETMADADRRSDAVEAAVINLMESVVLASQVGRTFPATVIDFGHDRATVQLRDPPVVATIDEGGVALSDRIEVRLARADPYERQVKFELA